MPPLPLPLHGYSIPSTHTCNPTSSQACSILHTMYVYIFSHHMKIREYMTATITLTLSGVPRATEVKGAVAPSAEE